MRQTRLLGWIVSRASRDVDGKSCALGMGHAGSGEAHAVGEMLPMIRLMHDVGSERSVFLVEKIRCHIQITRERDFDVRLA